MTHDHQFSRLVMWKADSNGNRAFRGPDVLYSMLHSMHVHTLVYLYV